MGQGRFPSRIVRGPYTCDGPTRVLNRDVRTHGADKQVEATRDKQRFTTATALANVADDPRTRLLKILWTRLSV